MADPTDIEKKSLEAHVELCAERYRMLEHKLSTVENKVSDIHPILSDLKNMISKFSEKRNDQLIAWGLGIIATLTVTIGWLLKTYVFIN
jgi:hypothetical protein